MTRVRRCSSGIKFSAQEAAPSPPLRHVWPSEVNHAANLLAIKSIHQRRDAFLPL
jgi:hypothetical protein